MLKKMSYVLVATSIIGTHYVMMIMIVYKIITNKTTYYQDQFFDIDSIHQDEGYGWLVGIMVGGVPIIWDNNGSSEYDMCICCGKWDWKMRDSFSDNIQDKTRNTV